MSPTPLIRDLRTGISAPAPYLCEFDSSIYWSTDTEPLAAARHRTRSLLELWGLRPNVVLINCGLSFRMPGWVVVLVVTHPWVGRTGQVNLGVLTQFVSPDLVERAIAGRTLDRSRRAGPLPMGFAVYFELALALFAGNSYEDVADDLVCSVPALYESVPAKSALLGARRRLGEEAMRAVFEHVVAQPVAGESTLGARWSGFRVFGVDGFALEVPDTEANRACFDGPSASNGRNQARPVGYPQAKVVTLIETGTRAPRAAAIGGYRTGEMELAVPLAAAVGHGDLVLFDRGFPSIALWRAFDERGAAIVMRAKATVARTNPRPLPDGTHLVEMWTRGRVGRGDATCVTMRQIEYRIDGGETIRLLTNLLDTARYPAGALAALYAERWQCETGNLQIKTLQMGRASILRSREPGLVRQEIWAHLTVNAALTRLITLMADERRSDPERISFTKVLKQARRTVIQQVARHIGQAARHALDIADDLRRYHNPQRPPRASDHTIKRLRHRYPERKPDTRGKPVTITTPPKTIALLTANHN